MDLRYNEEKLKALGIPPEVAAYLRALNESLVKIKGEALLDESANVKVLENSDGTPNPNHGSLFSEEGARWLVEKEGWSRRKKSGVPQGAATSCSLSTVSLRELFEERFPGRLTMYADDGVCFPENGKEDPDLSIPAGGILKSEEKSF